MSRVADHAQHTVRAGSPARAVLHAGGVDTEYLRAGHGEAMVLLAPVLDAPEVQGTIARLAQHYLVLAAALPSQTPGATRWLDEFLEGLGFSHAHVMLHSSLPEQARMEFAAQPRG